MCKRNDKRLALAVAVGSIALIASSVHAAPKAPRVQTGATAEITHDGLHRVDRSVMDAAWVKPDLDLTGYTKLMLVSVGISYKEDPDYKGTFDRSATEFPIDEENRERLQRTVREEFLEEFEMLERYEIVTEPGPGVLMLIGGVLDVVSRVPPERPGAGARGGVYLTSVGDATLVLELRDSTTNEILARAADRRSAESAFAFEVNTVTAWSEVRRLAGAWARLLRTRLEELTGV
jgi:hypothetical protein